ncbi:MAG: type 4a pilus biogenesis protein PilO [Epulopiscium sp.]|nr:type 4a pilus biogenesis protein PilO [Candidatus Epulonipiscium sp.]
MNFIKDNSKILGFLLVALVIVGGFFYYNLVLTPQLETLQELEDDNEIKGEELALLQQEYQNLDQRKLELKDIRMQTKSMEEKVPTYEVAVIMMAEVMQYMDIYNFNDRHVHVGAALDKREDESDEYETIPVSIEYTSTYEDTVKFLEMVNRSFQMITIDTFSIDNAIQDQDLSSDDGPQFRVSKDTVETQVVLHMHCRPDGESEVYPNFMEYLEKEENIFERPLEIDFEVVGDMEDDQTQEEIPHGTADGSSRTQMEQRTRFNIHLADILRSGDNYSFSAYSPNQDPVYVGLASSRDTKLVITIRENGYTCVIEDSEGNKSEKTVDTNVMKPTVNITSQIQKVMEVMPTVSVHIHNYTPGIINVNMRGTSLENVLIYNENNELVVPGTQSGKIAVTR